MTIEITVEFREKVDKAARSVASRNTNVDWEDISQDVWVRLLEDVPNYEHLAAMEDPYRPLRKIATQEVYKANNAYEHYSGAYNYVSEEVKVLLSDYLLDITDGRVNECVDLVEGLLMLKTRNVSYFKVLVDVYVHHASHYDRKQLTRAVDKLVEMMNKVNQSARYSYEGPGSRKAVSIGQMLAKMELNWN